MNEKNHGFVAPTIKDTDYVFLGGNIPDDIIAPDGQYDDALPSDEFQDRPGILTYNCTGFGTSHAVVTYLNSSCHLLNP